nr:hypothetical protein [Desulfuromonadales bacterium]
MLSGAYWYGQKKPKRPSELFSLIEGLRFSIRLADCDEAGDRPDAPAIFDSAPAPDPHFKDGWRTALLQTIEDRGWARTNAGDKAAYDEHVDQLSLMLGELPKPADPTPSKSEPISVSSLVTYATCPKRYYWTDV